MIGLWPRWLKHEQHSVTAMQKAKAFAAEHRLDTNELLRGLVELEPVTARRLMEAEEDQARALAIYHAMNQEALTRGQITPEDVVSNLRNFPTLAKAS